MITPVTRQTVFAFIFALVLAITGSLIAWAGPSAEPPNNNVAAPLNVGTTNQTKNGGIWAASVGSDGGYCIGVDCISAWSDVGSSGSSQWTASTNTISYTAGNVGIGTMDPKSPLQVGQLGFMSSWPGIYFNTYWDSSAATHKYLTTNSASLIQQDYTNGGLSFYTAPSGPADSSIWDTPGTSMALFLKGNGNIGVGTTSPLSKLDVTGNIKVGSGSYFGNYGTINFPSSDNDNGFLWACTSSNGCATNTWDLRLYLQDDQDDSQRFSIWGGSCQNGGCRQDGNNVVEQFHATAAGNVWARGNMYAAGYFHNSDARLKEDVQTFPNALEIVKKLHGVTFNWKKDGTPSAGVVAQEVAQVIPSAVKADATTGMYSVEYDQLVAPMIEAIKTQQEQIDVQQERIASLEHEIIQLKAAH